MNVFYLLMLISVAMLIPGSLLNNGDICEIVYCGGGKKCVVEKAQTIISINEESWWCIKGVNYGITDNFIWVKYLCGMFFNICYVPVTSKLSTVAPFTKNITNSTDQSFSSTPAVQRTKSPSPSPSLTSAKHSTDATVANDNEGNINQRNGITSANQSENNRNVIIVAVPTALGSVVILVVIVVIIVCSRRKYFRKRSQKANMEYSMSEENKSYDVAKSCIGNMTSNDVDVVQYNVANNEAHVVSDASSNSVEYHSYHTLEDVTFKNGKVTEDEQTDHSEDMAGCRSEISKPHNQSMHIYENRKNYVNVLNDIHIQTSDEQYDKLEHLKTEVSNTRNEQNMYDHVGSSSKWDTYDRLKHCPVDTKTTQEGYAVWKSK